MRGSGRYLLPLAAFALWHVPASACAIQSIDRTLTRAEQRRDAALAVEKTDAIVDGDVVVSTDLARDGSYLPARVRAVRVLKGPQQEYFDVIMGPGCDPWLDAGERRRFFLTRSGADRWHLSAYGGKPKLVDRLLASDRYAPWPDGRSEPKPRY